MMYGYGMSKLPLQKDFSHMLPDAGVLGGVQHTKPFLQALGVRRHPSKIHPLA